uniref:Uncharacterized protein n=1 Tax=Ciona savignyi TaxID=51511 RepID=H2ZFR0_CIOSA
MENQVVLSDYTQMDRVLREERQYTLNLVKQILRDALSDLALHFLNKMKILVVKDIERQDIEFVCKSTGCKPIASIDHFSADMLASAELVEEVNVGTGRIVKVKGCSAALNTVSILVRGSNKLVLHEAERSLHDALCVVRWFGEETSNYWQEGGHRRPNLLCSCCNMPRHYVAWRLIASRHMRKL